MSLVSIFASAIAPIVAIGAVGFLLGRSKDLDVDPLNTVVVYVLVPALVFHSLLTTSIDADTVAKLAVGVTAYIVVLAALAEVAVRAIGLDEPLSSATVLSSTYPNCGNFGIPLSAFAFGAVGRSTAVLFLAIQSVLIYSHGVYIAARSGGSGGLSGVKRVFTIPLLYAVLAALVLRFVGVSPDTGTTVMQTLKLVGDAAIPLMLLMLGSQLVGTDVRAALGPLGLANVMKLLVAPLVGIGIVLALAGLGFGVQNSTVARVFVLECATPAAITPLILILEFGGEGSGVSPAEFVSSAVLTSTLASMVTLTALIAVLRSGVVI
ncbi:AEC family transporter [Halomarina litorea]|uniref:AEC family transporter n=1 Tax=Halomarina litorea TaxID=2961595 RepID=UPI0020C383FC|nr:AEC family transporter [Halomarina sp. BCD28]